MKSFIAALLAAEKTAFKEFEGTPYFEGCLPIEVMAERGPETLRYGPMKPVGLSNPHRPGREALCRGAAASGQCARQLVEHGRLPDQAEAWRAGARVPHDPWARAGRVRAARRPASQYLPQQPEAARCRAQAQSRSAASLRGADHRRRGLCGVGGDRADRRTLRRVGAARPRLRRRRRPRRSARCSITSPAGISAPTATALREASSR